MASLIPSLTSMEFWVDCMPIVDTDPIHGKFTATYDNSGGTSAQVATLTSVKLLLDDGVNAAPSPWTFVTTPATSGVVAPASTVVVDHVKVQSTGSGPKGPCGFCNGQWTLEVTWQVGAATVTDTLGPEAVMCAF